MKTFIFYCLLIFLPTLSVAQDPPTLTQETIEKIKCNNSPNFLIEPQRVKCADAFLVRFNELGTIYNPDFPTTRTRIYCTNFQKVKEEFTYIGKSISTFRATVQLKGRVGEFYGIWSGKDCSSMIEYIVVKNGDYLEITGKVYKCF